MFNDVDLMYLNSLVDLYPIGTLDYSNYVKYSNQYNYALAKINGFNFPEKDFLKVKEQKTPEGLFLQKMEKAISHVLSINFDGINHHFLDNLFAILEMDKPVLDYDKLFSIQQFNSDIVFDKALNTHLLIIQSEIPDPEKTILAFLLTTATLLVEGYPPLFVNEKFLLTYHIGLENFIKKQKTELLCSYFKENYAECLV